MGKVLNKKFKTLKQGEIWLIKCDKIKEFSKDYRPALIISDDLQNEYGEHVVVLMMTTNDLENIRLFEVFIENTLENGLDEASKIIVNYPFTIFKKLRLEKYLGIANRRVMEQVKKAWQIAFNVEKW